MKSRSLKRRIDTARTVLHLKATLESERARCRVADQRADENASSAAQWKAEAEKLARRVESAADEFKKLRHAVDAKDCVISRLEGYQERVREEDNVRLRMSGFEPEPGQ